VFCPYSTLNTSLFYSVVSAERPSLSGSFWRSQLGLTSCPEIVQLLIQYQVFSYSGHVRRACNPGAVTVASLFRSYAYTALLLHFRQMSSLEYFVPQRKKVWKISWQ